MEIKSYKLGELVKTEHLSHVTIKKRHKYIPIQIVTGESKSRFTTWRASKEYILRYIKLDDVIKFLKEKGDVDFYFTKK